MKNYRDEDLKYKFTARVTRHQPGIKSVAIGFFIDPKYMGSRNVYICIHLWSISILVGRILKPTKVMEYNFDVGM